MHTHRTRQQQLDRLSVPLEAMKWSDGEVHGRVSALEGSQIILDPSADPHSRILDQLAFSHGLQRHMKRALARA